MLEMTAMIIAGIFVLVVSIVIAKKSFYKHTLRKEFDGKLNKDKQNFKQEYLDDLRTVQELNRKWNGCLEQDLKYVRFR